MSAGGWNIDPLAYGGKAKEGSMYPAQVRVEYCPRCPPMEEQYFKPAIAANYFNPNRFRWELNERQVSYMQSHYHLSCQPASAWMTCSCQTRFHLHTVTVVELPSNTMCNICQMHLCCVVMQAVAQRHIPVQLIAFVYLQICNYLSFSAFHTCLLLSSSQSVCFWITFECHFGVISHAFVLYCDACCEYLGGGAAGLVPRPRNAMATKVQC